MKKIIILLFLSGILQAQTLVKLNQLQKSSPVGSGSVIVTDNTGTPTYSTLATITGSFLPINNPAYTGSLTTGTPSYTDINIWSMYQGSNNNYYQSIWQNSSNGNQASVDLVLSNDVGSKTNFYGNFGMNSSTFTGTPIFSKPSLVYLTATGSDLGIGTTTNSSLYFGTNNAVRFKIDSVGAALLYSTTATPTLNGSFYYDGGLGGKNGFNLYSDDPSNASYLLSVSNSTNYFHYYADHSNNNWFAVRPNSSMMFSVDNAGTVSYEIDQSNHVWTVHTATSSLGSAVYRWNSANHTGQTASSEVTPFSMSPFGIQYATGSLPRQRGMNFGQMTINFVAASSVTNSAANFYIAGGVVAGTNASIPESSGLQVGGMTGTTSLGAGTTNGYAITAYAPTGATNNYAARFLQGNVGIGTSSPTALLHLGAGSATVPAFQLTTQSTFTSGTTGAFWYTSPNFNFNGGIITPSVSIGTSAVSNSLTSFHLVKGTGTLDIGEYTSGRAAIWINRSNPALTDFALSADNSNNTFVNGSSQVFICSAASIVSTFGINNISFSPSFASSGAKTTFSFTVPNHTGQTVSTEIPDYVFTSGVKTWGGASTLPLERVFKITSCTAAFGNPSTITDFATFCPAAPTMSTNAAATNVHAILVQSSSLVGATGTVTNGYGLTINAPTGATNNYAAQFIGGNVGIGTAAPSATLGVSGSFAATGPSTLTGISNAYTGKTASYTLTSTDYAVDCTANTFTVTLPAAASNMGRIYVIKNSGAGIITVQGNGAELIDAANTKTLAVQYSGVTLMCTGSKFIIIGTF